MRKSVTETFHCKRTASTNHEFQKQGRVCGWRESDGRGEVHRREGSKIRGNGGTSTEDDALQLTMEAAP